MTMDTSSNGVPGTPASPAGGSSESTTPTTTPGAGETEPYEQAGSEIVELVRGFVEGVGTHIRDARSAAESARADRADAVRIRQETIKRRAEAEAAQIVDAARADADRMRAEARAEAAEIKRVFGTAVAGLESAQEKLADVIDRLGGNVGQRTTETFVVIPDAPDKAATDS